MQVVKKSRLWTNMWMITAGSSRVITIWTLQYGLYHVTVDRIGAINKIHSCVNSTATHQWISFITDDPEKY